jgi:hypothetical protein
MPDARVTPSDLRTAPLVATALENETLQVYAEAAHDMVEEIVTPNTDYDDNRLKEIERFVAAHLATASDPSESSSGAGEFRTEYESPSEIEAGLGETRYGRRALDLDTDNVLTSTSAGAVFQSFGASYDSHGNS